MHRSKEKRKRKYTKEDQDVYMAVVIEYTLDKCKEQLHPN